MTAFADGVFVVPKFVWDKRKDINEPTQKAILVYDAGQEDMVLQVKYEGPLDEFGWLIPVPSRPTVKKDSMKCFYELSQYTQRHFPGEAPPPGKAHEDFGMATLSAGVAPEPPVKVVEIKTVGAYEIAVLSTRDSGALTQWLQTNQYYFPPDKTDVLNSYVKQQWYFVAVKINLGHSLFGVRFSTASQLASGELTPLQISFATSQCVFPLKISSVNGRPSEVQVYVLSPEPLLEREMLEKKLPLIYSNNLAEANQRAQQYKNMTQYARRFRMPFDEGRMKSISESLVASEYDLLPYAKVAPADLPDCCKWIPSLAGKSWWLTKQTWIFKPDEMHDLAFKPAIPYFASQMGSIYGYFAAQNLTAFGSDAVPAVIVALQSTNPVARLRAARMANPFGYNSREPFHDPRLGTAALPLLKDTDPQIRAAAANILSGNWNAQYAAPLVEVLTDTDSEVRVYAEIGLTGHPSDITNFISHFQELLKYPNPGIRAVSYELLRHLHVPVTKDDLLGVFQASGMGIGVVWYAYNDFKELTGRNPTDAEDQALLQNPDVNLRGGLGLTILYQNADKQAVEMALPLLNDPEPGVRAKAAATLRALTGRDFTEEQGVEWDKWWTESKTNFVADLHPEELSPLRR